MNFRQFIENIEMDADGSVTVRNVSMITDRMWGTINYYMRRKGYDWLGAGDAETLMGNILKRNGGKIDASIFPDHAAAIKYAFKLREKRPARTPDQKVLTAIKKHFGMTNNYNVAGYILPDGSMLNFSGQNRGAGPGDTRGEDHRAIGHFLDRESYDAIREFGNRFGAISLHFGNNYATMRIYQAPTDKQINRIKEIKNLVDEMMINLHLGQKDALKMYGKRDHGYVVDLKRFFA